MREYLPPMEVSQEYADEIRREREQRDKDREPLRRVVKQIRDLAKSLPPDQVQSAMKQIIAAIEKDSPSLRRKDSIV